MALFLLSLIVSGLFPAGQDSPGLARVAVAGNPPVIYHLVDAGPGRSAIVAYGPDASGEAIARWEIDGDARALVVTGDADRACILGNRPQSGRRRGDGDSRPWTLTLLDLTAGRATQPIPLIEPPLGMTLLSQPGSEPKLLVATSDRISAYSLDPPGTSWFYKAPGDNRAIAAGGAAIVAILRGRSLAIIDPAGRPRIDGRLQLTDDDVTSSIDLPSAGLAVGMSDDGRVAAVLHEDRLRVSAIDIAAGKVMASLKLSEPVDAPVLRIVGASGAGYRLMVASVSPLPLLALLEIGSPEPPAEPVAESKPAPIPEPVRQPVLEPPPEPPAEPVAESKPAPIPEPVRKPVPEPPPGPPAEPVAGSPPPVAPDPEPTPEPVVEPARPSDESFLTGRLTGDIAAAREVRFYGPDNILKLQARAAAGPDGFFKVALPPAGSYRVIVTGAPESHLFTRPEFRMVIVGADGKGVSGIDFEVRGRL